MEPVQSIIDESWYIRPPGPPGVPDRHNAGGVVARREGERVLVALLRERKHPDYVLPKGGIERGETAEMAARREIAEEAGFTALTLLAELGTRERLSFKRRKWTTVHYFLYVTEEIDVTPIDQENHAEKPFWFPLEKLPPFFWPEQRELIETNYQKILDAVMQRYPL
jgi:8-oxo-dGTP pyrophosphatase MutT (NUDIX family)